MLEEEDDGALDPAELVPLLDEEFAPLPFVVDDVQALAISAMIDKKARTRAGRRIRLARFGLVTLLTVSEPHIQAATLLGNITGL